MAAVTPANISQPRKEEAVSIKVTIEHKGGMFHRVLNISRSQLDERNGDNPEAVNRYIAALSNGDRIVAEGIFEHRYGDDLLTLVAEAVDTLGGRGGPLTTGLKR